MTPERDRALMAALRHRQPDITVILENVFDPHNISAVMRTCDSVGIQEVFVLTTRMPKHEKFGWRSSSGAYKWLTVHQFENLDECLIEVRSRYSRVMTTLLSHEATDIYAFDFTSSIALVFGNEFKGCSPEMIAQCDGSLVIPQVGIIQSLNISVACAVTLYEAFRQKRLAGHYDAPRLSAASQKNLQKNWGYYFPKNE
jgi:tRNA (guanosine-2'-O-)-methyltransferase